MVGSLKNKEIIDALWPGLKMVHGKPRHSQSQGSVERANRDIENLIACWQAENNSTNRAKALQIIQFQKNTKWPCLAENLLLVWFKRFKSSK